MLQSKVCGQYWHYPDLTETRQAEGGKRLQAGRKKGTPKISIITVVYNGEQNLERCILSVKPLRKSDKWVLN